MSNSHLKQTFRRSIAAVAALAVSLVALGVSSPVAVADVTISEPGEGAGQTSNPYGLAVDRSTGNLYVADRGNRRVDVFDSEGNFAMAFGWGVADGASELQTCGPAAAPPTAICKIGLRGGGAGQFGEPIAVAVDNSGGPSNHDVYVVDTGRNQLEGSGGVDEGYGVRIQKFTPEGEFLLTWGGGVITSGAAGTGNLSAGSTQINSVQTTEKAFEVGQTITAPGKIPASTTIVSVGPGTITLSKPAAGSGTAAPISVAAGPGNVPTNERQLVEIEQLTGEFTLRFSTVNPSNSAAQTEPLPYNASPALVQAALEALPNIGAGNVSVSSPNPGGLAGEVGGPYTVEFKGARFADTNVVKLGLSGIRGDVMVLQSGHGAAAICTAAIAPSCAAGVEGAAEGQFADRRYGSLAVGPGGEVYVADPGVLYSATGSANRLQAFTSSGSFVEALALPEASSPPVGLAVDSGADFYVSAGGVRRYDSDGNLLETHNGPAGAVSVDSSDDLFVHEEEAVGEYDPSGSLVRRFGYGAIKGSLRGLAPYSSASGDLYTSEGDMVFHRSFPPPGPVVFPEPCKTSFLGNTKAVLSARVNPEGNATTFHFQYVDDESFDSEGGFASPNTKTTPESTSIGADFDLHAVTAEASLVPETEYHCRVVATNADAPASVIGVEGTFTALPPLQVEATWSSDVGSETATLNAEVNPLGIPTTGYFQYVDEATYQKDIAELGSEHGFDHAIEAPDIEDPIDFGAGEDPKPASVTIGGLQPGGAYRFRIVATDPLIAPKEVHGPTQGLRTYRFGQGGLADGRAYEQVSPAQKNSAEVAAPGSAGGLLTYPSYTRIQASATSGEAFTYTSWTAFADPEAAPSTSQYLARRTPSGWQTENLFPFGEVRAGIPPYRGFGADLRFGGMTLNTALGEGIPGFENLYLRDNQTGSLQALTIEAPTSVSPGERCFDYAGSSADGSKAFFASNSAYAGAPAGEGFSLYEWSAANGLRPVSILPGKSSAAAPTEKTAFGASISHCQTGENILRNVVSPDGERVIWTYVPSTGSSQLLARVGGEETVQLDKKVSGFGGSGNGVFLAASADGSRVLFKDENKLVSGAGEGDLYRYDFDSEGTKLIDLTPGAGAGVEGLVGASDDLSYAYFVATGVLTGEEENEAGEKAEAGARNLYLSHGGEAVFIAVLGPGRQDELNWSPQPSTLGSRVSPDGRHLAFLSTASKRLVGYDNTVADGVHCELNTFVDGPLDGGPLCSQAFLYDADSAKLVCASCKPSGGRPLGPTTLPGWSNPLQGPRYLSDDGQRFFFESGDALLPTDENEKRDVYEFERAGKGSCTSGSPTFSESSEGCLFLVSGGKDTSETYLLDASASGRDVFFVTRGALVGWDTDAMYDVYDAREGGGFPEPAEAPICAAEACKTPPAAAPPSGSSPGTATFQGPGNPSSSGCPKGKVRRKARCVKRHGKARHRKGKAQRKGRAGR
jgi:hypothetical protein